MKILHLTLKKQWFEKILSGEKKEEFREIKEYWNKRLNKEYDYIFDKTLSEYEIMSRYINQNKGYKYISADELIEFLNEI